MKSFVGTLLKLVVLAILLLILLKFLFIGVWLKQQSKSDANTKTLELAFFENTPVDINVPVRYIDKDELITHGASLETKDKKRFCFRTDRKDPNRFWITKFSYCLGVRLGARYQITDPEIEKQLVELFRKYEIEESLRFQQEENRTKKAPDSTTDPKDEIF